MIMRLNKLNKKYMLEHRKYGELVGRSENKKKYAKILLFIGILWRLEFQLSNSVTDVT